MALDLEDRSRSLYVLDGGQVGLGAGERST